MKLSKKRLEQIAKDFSERQRLYHGDHGSAVRSGFGEFTPEFIDYVSLRLSVEFSEADKIIEATMEEEA